MCSSSPPPPPDYTRHNQNLLDQANAKNKAAADNYNQQVSAFNLALTGGSGTRGGTPASTTTRLPEITTTIKPTGNSENPGYGRAVWNVEGRPFGFGNPGQAQAWAKANPITVNVPGTPGEAYEVDGWSNRVGNYAKQLGGIDISNFWDDPTTAANENIYQSLYDQGLALQREFAGLKAPTAPELMKRVQGGGGAVLDVFDLPTLQQANMDLYNTLNSDLTGALQKLDALNKQRQAEEARIKGFTGNLGEQLAGLQTGLGQLSISDKSSMDALERELARLQAQRSGFSSSILDQVGGFGNLDQQFNSISQGLTGLRDQRSAEEQRIKQFEQGLLSEADRIRQGLGGVSIADLDGLTGLRSSVQDQLRSANRFSSSLGFDLSQEAGELQSLQQQIDALFSKRTAEQQRVQAAQANFGQDARTLQQMLGNAGIYDLNTINSYGSQIENLRNQIGGFTSELGADFSGIDLGALDSAYAGLLDRRQQALNPFMETLGGLGDGIGSLELWDEEARKQKMAGLMDLRTQMGSFTGSDVNDIRTQLGNYLTELNTQADQLSARRGEINTDAEALLQAIKDGSYYDQSDVVQRQTEAQQLADLVSKFGVKNATDEVAAIEAFLSGQTNRLEQDAQNVQARQSQGQSFAQNMLSGNGLLDMLNQRNLSDDEIMQLMAMLSQQERNQGGAGMGGTFSQLMGA